MVWRSNSVIVTADYLIRDEQVLLVDIIQEPGDVLALWSDAAPASLQQSDAAPASLQLSDDAPASLQLSIYIFKIKNSVNSSYSPSFSWELVSIWFSGNFAEEKAAPQVFFSIYQLKSPLYPGYQWTCLSWNGQHNNFGRGQCKPPHPWYTVIRRTVTELFLPVLE